MTPAQLLADLAAAHPEALAAPAPGQLPEGVQAGHRHAYRGGGRMGLAYAQADGRFTERATGAGRRHTWAERNAAGLAWQHAPYECAGCGR